MTMYVTNTNAKDRFMNKNEGIEKEKMVTDQKAYSIHQDILKHASELLRFEVPHFYQKNKPSEENRLIGFEDQAASIDHARKHAEFLLNTRQQDAIKYPRGVLTQIRNSLQKLVECFRQMRNLYEEEIPFYNLEKEEAFNLENRRDNLANQFDDAYSSFHAGVNYLNDLKHQDLIEDLKSQIRSLENIQIKEGIDHHFVLFGDQAAKHQQSAKYWFIFGLELVGFTMLFGWYNVENLANELSGQSTDYVLSLLGIRFFLFGLLSSVIFWTFKNYRIQAHNELINSHRDYALRTFPNFSKASVDDKDNQHPFGA